MFSPFVDNQIYTREEVRYCWDKFKAFNADSVKKNSHFVLYYTEDVGEAITVAMLFVRHLTLCMTDTYYEPETKLLYLYYGTSPVGKKFIDKVTTRIIAFASKNKAKLDQMTYDMHGRPLFAKNL